jgi:hypothetical protein
VTPSPSSFGTNGPELKRPAILKGMDDAPGTGQQDDDVEPAELVASVGPLDPVVALLREFLHRSGAIRAVALMEHGVGEGPALVDVGQLLPIEVVVDEQTYQLPHAIELDVPEPDVPDVRQLPPFEVDRESGQIAAMIGGVEHYAEAVIGLTRRVGPRDVVVATWRTNDPETPISISARGQDPIVITLGEDEYEMEPGWPPPARAI